MKRLIAVSAIAPALLLTISACSSTAWAQNSEPFKPSCNITRKAFDNPFRDGMNGYWLPRYQWHALKVGAVAMSGEVLHRTTRLPRWAAFTMSGVAIAVVPHIRGVTRGAYAFDAKDWAFDTFLGAVPLAAWSAWQGTHRWESRAVAGTAIAGGYLALACVGSP